MHTATRLAGPVIQKARRLNQPGADLRVRPVCAAQRAVAALARGGRGARRGIRGRAGGDRARDGGSKRHRRRSRRDRRASGLSANPALTAVKRLPRLQFLVPDRSGLPPLSRYATLHMPDGTRKVVGSTEASRGCKHLCRHCPVVPDLPGTVPRGAAGGRPRRYRRAGRGRAPSTSRFGDPDFFNGPTHAMHIVDAMHAAHPARQLRRHDQGRASASAPAICCRDSPPAAARS